MSLSQPCVHTLPDKPDLHHLIGLVGIDLHMEDVVQDVTYYSHADNSYAFIVTSQGEYFVTPSTGALFLPLSNVLKINCLPH